MNGQKYFLFLLVISLYSCSRNEKPDGDKTENIPLPQTVQDEPVVSRPDSLPWIAQYNQDSQKLKLVRTGQDISSLQASGIIRLANKKYPKVSLKIKRQIADTLVLSIPDAFYLTQSMGSAGAETYLAEVTYSLTELPSVNVVKFNFTEGDHAVPGTYSRKSFKHFN